MFYGDHLIIGYIREPQHNRYLFQLAGGEELPISREEFLQHWQEYCAYEADRASQTLERYRPLPITLQIRQKIEIFPVDLSLRRKSASHADFLQSPASRKCSSC